MAISWTTQTQARTDATKGLGIIAGLMEYASDKRGRRSKKEISLYMASVTFAYAVWENFVEEIAMELVTSLAHSTDGLQPEQLRPHVRELIEDRATPWELAVEPGWRQLWIRRIKEMAVGEDGGGWGINAANFKNTKRLFKAVGINPLPDACKDRLDALVDLRGEIAHTAKTKTPIYKAEVGEWSDFVADLCSEVDVTSRKQCRKWLAG